MKSPQSKSNRKRGKGTRPSWHHHGPPLSGHDHRSTMDIYLGWLYIGLCKLSWIETERQDSQEWRPYAMTFFISLSLSYPSLYLLNWYTVFQNVLYNLPLHLFPFQCHCTVSIIGFCSLNYNTFSMVLYEGTKSILLFFSGSPLLRAISLQSDQRSNCLIFSYFIFHVFLLVLAEPEVDVHFPKPFALYNGRDLMANVLP